jgi:organic hydroperoxide reductase OsmC/OhrA
MHPLPHHYSLSAAAAVQGDVALTTDGPSTLLSASPRQFDGPGDLWSPETLLVGAVGDCLILTFRAIARAARLGWTSMRCDITGTLDRVDRATQFTSFDVHAHLELPAGADPAAARRLLEKAEQNCLISNSLKAAVHLVPDIVVTPKGPETSHERDTIRPASDVGSSIC